ncbi:MAG: calcium/sodium antiporter [Firmicutes bacterium]|nr:calcium/sodium antiporter [Bacillota bacterium]
MIETVGLLLLGFILIIVASDILVDSASSVAIKCKVPKMLIALTIVSFGTCAPEIAISFNSVASHNGTIAFANVIGSCIVNILLIVGLASFLHPIKVKNSTVKRELPILTITTAVFSTLILDSMFNKEHLNVFSRADGIILVLLFSIFVLYLIRLVRNRDKNQAHIKQKYTLPQSIILLIISLVAITWSSDLIVDNALIIANELNLSEKFITMFLIVIATSLPELFMTVSSARKKEYDIAIGNIIGTNIFNICIVLGAPIVIYGDLKIVDFKIIDIFVLFLSSAILQLFAHSEKVISKREGLIMFIIFSMYYLYLAF